MLARYQGMEHISSFRAWRALAQDPRKRHHNECDAAHRDAEEEEEDDNNDDDEEEEQEEEEEEEEDEGGGERGFVGTGMTAIWYLSLLAIAAVSLLIALPHVYLAMPPCDDTSQVFQRVLGSAGGKRARQGCLGVSHAVEAVVHHTADLVHQVMSVVLPLPSQPGTEQYWAHILKSTLCSV